MNVTATMVKQLRDATGAAMMDCKKALLESNGRLDAASEMLRVRALAEVDARTGRVAAEGLLGVVATDRSAVVVEVNVETDFAARTEQFRSGVGTLAHLASSADGDIDRLAGTTYPGTGHSVSDELASIAAILGEKTHLRRVGMLSVTDGIVVSHLYGAVAPGICSLAVLVALRSDGDQDALAAFGKQLAIHIATCDPMVVSAADMDPEVVARERTRISDRFWFAAPEPLRLSVVEGEMQRYFDKVSLMRQAFTMDERFKVQEAIRNAEKDVGAPIELIRFVRFKVGEGIARPMTNYPAKIARISGIPDTRTPVDWAA